MDWRQYIVSTPDTRSGKPRIDGTRITVQDILEYLGGGMAVEELLEDFPQLRREQI